MGRWEGFIIETGGSFERGCLFNLANTMVSVLHKEVEYIVEKSLLTRRRRSCSRESKTNAK